MSADIRTDKDTLLADVRAKAREYFARRDDLEVAKDELLDSILAAADRGGATQHEIADECDLTSESGNGEHQFHRTRIQQFLRTARRGR